MADMALSGKPTPDPDNDVWGAQLNALLDELDATAQAKYTKPAGGIDTADLASGVQDKLAAIPDLTTRVSNVEDVATSAYQVPPTGIPLGTLSSGVQASLAKADGSVPASTVTTKGDLLARTSTAVDRVPVGADGQVLTADAASTAGVKWASPAASGVSSVNGDTGPNVVLDAADVGAVPTARNVTAGTGLSGGGDLSVDRALSVQYGATAGTAAQGDDSRLVDNAKSVKGGAEKVAAGSATTGTVTLDCSAASVFTITPTGDITLAPSNVPASGTACTITVVITQGATVRAVSMPSGNVWLGSAPTQTASKKCAVTMLTTDGGTSWLSSGAVQA